MAESRGVAGHADRSVDRHEVAALAAIGLVPSRPAAAARAFRAVLRSPASGPAARAIALWGLGQIAHGRSAINDATIALTEAVDLAADTGRNELVAEIRVSLAATHQSAGDTAAAVAQLDLAEPHLGGALLGKALTQRGFLAAVAGDREAALRHYDHGLALLQQGGDEPAVLRSLLNRSTVRMQLGDFAGALDDLTTAREMAERLGQRALAAGAVHGQAYLEARLGRSVDAARGFADARARYLSIGSLDRHLNDLDIDECEVLLEWGLGADAVPLAERVERAARSDGNAVQLADSLVMVARARLLAGDPAGASRAADEAVELFGAARRSGWQAHARYWSIVAASQTEGSGPAMLRQIVRLRRVADELERFGWASEAVEVRVLSGRVALDAGRADIARRMLELAATSRAHAQARVRADAWLATALLALAEGRRAHARRALSAGLRAVAAHRASLGAAELRSSTGRFGAPLAELGMRLALDGRRASDVFEWAERGRAGALGAPSATRGHLAPAGLRAELRTLRQRESELLADGAPDLAADASRRATELELAMSRASRQRLGGVEGVVVLRGAALRPVLDRAVLVEYVEDRGRLLAIVCRRERLRLVELGAVADIVVANEHLVFAVRRLAAVASGPIAQRSWVGFVAAAGELDRLLFAPLRRFLGDGPVVVVPTGGLHQVLWAALPTAARAAGVTVVPSAAWWARAAPAPRRRRVLLVAGPQLQHAGEEIAALRRLHPSATVLAGADATVDAVLDGMAASTLVHIAAHGVFRTDNPLFSTLELHDGPLFVHELEGLATVPHSVVLAACSSGRSGVLPGDELLGTTAVLMSLGVRTVIAPLLPVADRVTVEVAVALHRALRRGASPGAAIAGLVRQAVREERHDLVAASASFTCLAGKNS